MKTYISILRGINVSGHKLIKIDALKKMFENLGYKNVQTYVQSGNIIFQSKENNTKNLEEVISSEIKDEFGFEVPVIVFNIKTLETIIQNNPFINDKHKDISSMHVTFLAEKPIQIDEETIVDKKDKVEEIEFTPQAIYLYCPNGYGNTKLNNNFLEKKLKVKATTRNWRTTNELLNLARKLKA